MAIEKYIAAASLGLFIMFVGEIITVYNFMINPPQDVDPANPILQFEPEPKLLQYISIGVAPAVILAGVAFILSRRYGSKPIGALILGGGIILLGGMAFTYSQLDKVEENFRTPMVYIVPPLFIGISIPVIVVGVLLFKIKKKRTKDYF
jgi:RsiW-degrading membrane proteinase PrsW (M82 family)